MRTVVSEGVSSFDPWRWDRLAAGSGFYVGADWLLAWEQPGEPRLLVVAILDGDGQLLGALPCLEGRSGAGNPRYDLRALFDHPPLDRGCGPEWDPQLLGGGRAGYSGGVLVDPSLEAGARAEVLGALLERFLALADELGCSSAAIAYLDRPTLDELLPLAPRGMVPLLTTASARMDVPWRDFDGYLGSLSASRRSNARRDLRAFESAGYEIVVDRLSPWIERIAPLLAKVQSHHGGDGSVPGAAGYLRLCARAGLDDRSILFLARRGGELAGFALAYAFGGRLYMRLAGLDYDEGRDHRVYFNTYFYAPVRHAIAHGLRHIDFGLEAWESKLRKGGWLEPLWSLARLPGDDFRAQAELARAWNSAGRREWADAYGHLSQLGAELWATPACPGEGRG